MGLSQHQRNHLLEVSAQLASRRAEALRLYVPNDNQVDFHKSNASERLVIGGNRSGKSCSSFVELARAVTGQDPYNKFPKENGVAMVVGRNWQHIGSVAHRYLFRSGAFKIIKDKKKWRAFDYVKDKGREKEAKPAPPLIPPRMVEKISWQLKSANYISLCELKNGWTIHFYSSDGEIPQGISADVVVFDEEVQRDDWLPEMQARLADRKGRFWCACMPHSSSDWLLGLTERADAAEESGNSERIQKFILRFMDNPAIDSEEKSKMVERWAAQGADILRQRSDGEFTFDSYLVYPSFSMVTHKIDRDKLENLQIPSDWTRYLAIDPGHQVAAGLFLAVPPEEDMLVVYDEVYVRQANAVSFAKTVKQKLGVQRLHAMLIDGHGARITDMGSGRNVGDQYSRAFKEAKIFSTTTGSSFLLGCDDVSSRVSATLTAMMIRPSGTPKLRILNNACPNFEREIKKYRKKTSIVNGTRVITDVPNTKGECHAVQCLEYLVASEPRYIKPEEAPQASNMHPLVENYLKRKAQASGDQCVFSPAGASNGGVDYGRIAESGWV